ncbi:MAG: flagellar basal body-associated FliL family protein [Micavibrio aeruginosavorus]|uniref:Flagellar basal body-associated FliL family protein n=1 Tax=Micavibrio aeruginosavorus TaxID=349221 RepID=A0A7T5R0C8_9BACT|nr:MAG: flagellar basal body-associated FliL family protein [Micavibrio aeruginosavorus]
MKMAFLALAAVVVLGAGAGGAYFYFGQKAEASVGENAEHAEAREAKDSHKKDKGGHAAYVEMDPLILPIVDAEGVSQIVSLVVVLQVHDETQKAEVSSQMPRIKDAYIQDMYGVLNKHAAMKGGVVQVGIIKEKLNTANTRILGDGVVEDVLLQVVQQRPI